MKAFGPASPERPQGSRARTSRRLPGRADATITLVFVSKPSISTQDLVERLLALIVAATETGAALTTDPRRSRRRSDARRVALAWFEQVRGRGSHRRRRNISDELRAGDAEEGTPASPRRLDASGSCGAGRPDEQDAARMRAPSELTSPGTSGIRRLPGAPSWLVHAGHVVNVTTSCMPRTMRARLLPKESAWLLGPGPAHH